MSTPTYERPRRGPGTSVSRMSRRSMMRVSVIWPAPMPTALIALFLDRPLRPRSKAVTIRSLRLFFRDLQEWGLCTRRFDPTRALATPRAIKALIGPDPRVLADDLWAKLLWAGMHLEEQDVPKAAAQRPEHARPMYPTRARRALALTWLFAGSQRRARAAARGLHPLAASRGESRAATTHVPGENAACLLDVPTNKTGASYTKPVDPLVGEAIAAWEQSRPIQPNSSIARPASASQCSSVSAADRFPRSTSTER